MRVFLALAFLGSTAFAQSAPLPSTLENGLPAAEASKNAAELPPVPKGKSTVVGGVLQGVDFVRDQFNLKVYGGKKEKILFDERTQAFRDGKKISVLQLKPQDHVSIETTLDGTAVFALRVHMLTRQPEGEVSGQIAAYDAKTHELTVNAARSQAPIVLNVPAGTPVTSVAQNSTTAQPLLGFNFVKGSIITAQFQSENGGHGVATNISVYAMPGTNLVFRGHLSSVDLHIGRLVIIDPQTDQIHTIDFDPTVFPAARDLHKGSNVRVAATFTGSTFVATQITAQ